ncbi:glycoside hydrolase family 99-like domain-containing protein [Fusibacter sp. 3D3]|uniref:glycosyltransferase WbsX family protein n=1 Tax=Fusibacter sp. 3D3 TaxID=1048380 RepID=UPI000852BEE7|nr:glycoside hydrolase family 99-like domain-containing protein [Fusibacter sp. 3D3]GAU77784.1 glycosyltransferase [Fusibacter sp. 3D3]
MKILGLYLPQYHEIEENNKWWGEGYTEWEAVRSAKALYEGHYQPRKPLDNNYYDLLNDGANTWKWQAKIAKENGVYGFCIYHYWFLGKQLLHRPMEILLENKDIDTNYCICWANETWTKTWYGLESEVLMEQEYGEDKQWREHFNYLLPFFKDKRYIKVDNKPMINIYRSYDIEKLNNMISVWNEMAISSGFSGVFIISGNTNGKLETRENLIDAYYNFEPGFSLKHRVTPFQTVKYNFLTWIRQNYNIIFKKEILERTFDIRDIYKVNWKKLKYKNKPVIPCTLPMWDNTPRRKHKGFEYINASPKEFHKNLIQIKTNLHLHNEYGFVYVNAWNEWGEGAYLEPDEYYKDEYLKIIKSVTKDL